MPDARYLVPGDHLPDIHAQPKLLWGAIGRIETTRFLDWPDVHLPRETWTGELEGVAARVQFRHAGTAGQPLDDRHPALEIELALPTRGFRLSLYRSPDESLSPLAVAPELTARPARRAEAVPVAVARAILDDALEARLVELAEHIDEITIDDDKVLCALRLWPTEAKDLGALLELVQTLRRRADEAIEAAAGPDGSLLADPEVKAFRQRVLDREASARKTTAIVAVVLLGVPIAIAIYVFLLR